MGQNYELIEISFMFYLKNVRWKGNVSKLIWQAVIVTKNIDQ